MSESLNSRARIGGPSIRSNGVDASARKYAFTMSLGEPSSWTASVIGQGKDVSGEIVIVSPVALNRALNASWRAVIPSIAVRRIV